MDQPGHIDNLLEEYISGKSGKATQHTIRTWLNESDDNKKHYKKYSEAWALRQLPRVHNDKEVSHIWLLSQIIAKRKTSKFRIIQIVSGIAAAFLVGLIVASVYNKADTSQPVLIADSFIETIVPKGSRSLLLLPDGSQVWLNAGSHLKYNKNFGEAQRIVYLEGEAFFKVAKDSLKPFLVKTHELETRVTGTTFNIKNYDDEPETRLTLIEGEVNIGQPGDNTKDQVVIKPNQQFVYNKEKNTYSHQIVTDTESYTAWKDGLFYFRNETFEELIPRLERTYDVSIVLKTGKLKKQRFYGKFVRGESLEKILKTMDVEQQFKWVYTSDTIVIK